jgi:23S rRNA maturation-related 3'-5' exoribonuclease YhaM
MREKIVELLMSTKRFGMENLIEWMDNNGFFTAPCSGQYHLCKEGGLVEHSLNVYEVGNSGLHNLMINTPKHLIGHYDSWRIVSLLHDLGKAGQFGKPNYTPNMISDRKGGFIQSDKKPYETNKDLLPIPHEIRSIQIISQFIELTEEENFAILHHNGMYSDLKYQLQGKETPLQMILHFSDMWASRIVEE